MGHFDIVKMDSSEDTMEERRNVIGLMPIFLLALLIFIRISFYLCKVSGQKTRSPPRRRGMYGANRTQTQDEPTIYVSPANLPPPPKYEAMAPPSYEEVVGIHYPNYQVQPITQPITAAIAQSSTNNQTSVPNNATVIKNEDPVPANVTATTVIKNEVPVPSTVITVTSDERTPGTVATA